MDQVRYLLRVSFTFVRIIFMRVMQHACHGISIRVLTVKIVFVVSVCGGHGLWGHGVLLRGTGVHFLLCLVHVSFAQYTEEEK